MKCIIYGFLIGHAGVILFIHGYSHLYLALLLVTTLGIVQHFYSKYKSGYYHE